MATRYNAIQRWLRTKTGQTFLNYAYSWGASVVIAGALFKLTHTAGADFMLWLGMGTEVIVFFLAGFEPQEGVDERERAEEVAESAAVVPEVVNVAPPTGNAAMGQGVAASVVVGAVQPLNASHLADELDASAPFASAQFQGMSPEMQEATKAYVEQLTELTDTLRQVAEQSARLTRDSEEMENMNRTLTGINRFYEMQLKSVGTQSATIDEVNEQTRKLAAQLQELNEVYSRMVEALKLKIS